MKKEQNVVKKRRVVIAKLLLENSHKSNAELITGLKEYGIIASDTTIRRDIEFLKNMDLKKFLRSDSELYLEIRHKKLSDKIKKLEDMQKIENDSDKYMNLEKLIRTYLVDIGKIEKDLDTLAIQKIETEKTVYTVIIGKQKEVKIKDAK